MMTLLLLLHYFTAKRQSGNKMLRVGLFSVIKCESEFEMVMIFIWVQRFGNEFDVEENKENGSHFKTCLCLLSRGQSSRFGHICSVNAEINMRKAERKNNKISSKFDVRKALLLLLQ